MKQIPVTQGKFALVDEEDFEWLSQWKWTLSGDGYAYRGLYTNGKRSGSITMHRQVNCTPLDLVTDHINRNKLDNTRANLRSVSKSLNGFNTGLSRANSSGHKGVTWNKAKQRWQAQISVRGTYHMLGRFINLPDAVAARIAAELEYHVCA